MKSPFAFASTTLMGMLLIMSCANNAQEKDDSYTLAISVSPQILIKVAKNDLPERLSLEDAKKACAQLGEGWRLPTIDELSEMYINRDKIGGLDSIERYWSSTPSQVNKFWSLWVKYGEFDHKTYPNMDLKIRCVCSNSSDYNYETVKSKFNNPSLTSDSIDYSFFGKIYGYDLKVTLYDGGNLTWDYKHPGEVGGIHFYRWLLDGRIDDPSGQRISCEELGDELFPMILFRDANGDPSYIIIRESNGEEQRLNKNKSSSYMAASKVNEHSASEVQEIDNEGSNEYSSRVKTNTYNTSQSSRTTTQFLSESDVLFFLNRKKFTNINDALMTFGDMGSTFTIRELLFYNPDVAVLSNTMAIIKYYQADDPSSSVSFTVNGGDNTLTTRSSGTVWWIEP